MVAQDLDAKSDYERKLLRIIRDHGWQVTSVFDPEKVEPNFSYSVGIYHSLGQPELIVVGLSNDAAHRIINLYGERIRQDIYRSGAFVDDLINNYDAFLLDISSAPSKATYATSARWFYQTDEFPMFQCVWPSVDGKWPWDPDQSRLLAKQPLLAPAPP